MSTLMNSARASRARVPRFAEAAVERARLTVVPPRRSLGHTQAARTPFAVLVLAMLAVGVVGLLMFNTHMQQSSFKATALQDQVNALSAQEQSLAMELDQLRDPQRLAARAKRLGMVAPAQPAFVRLEDGRVLGNPAPASPGDAVRIDPLPAKIPDAFKQKTVIVKLPRTPRTPGAGTEVAEKQSTSRADTRGTSANDERGEGRKKANIQANSGAER